MDIKETFLNLTTHTVPHKKELEYLADKLPMNILKKDPVGNLYIKIGENTTTMFTSHLDTVGGDTKVNHVIEGKMIKSDGKSILGADDKAGVVIMLYMIHKGVPGLYQFFMGEEVGCVGSRALSSWVEKNKNNEIYKGITKVVSLDRKDVDSVITYQTGERCCSDAFADSLISQLKKQGLTYRKDTGGVLTDSVHFTDVYAECTNLSVGYWSQHTNYERQDIEFLDSLCKACVNIDWEGLTIKRKPGESERLRSTYSTSRNYHYYDDWDNEYGGGYGGGYGSRSSWKSTSHRTPSSDYVKDWRGNMVKTKDAVWCEVEKVYCLKDEAIWVDILGFYTPPDESIISTPAESSKDYSGSSSKVIRSGSELDIGDTIVHKQFGKGKVKNISPDGKKITVTFDKGEKQLLLSIAKIKKA